MSARREKLIVSKKNIDFLEMTAMKIVDQELELVYGKRDLLTGNLTISWLEIDNPQKKSVVIKSFIKQKDFHEKGLFSVESALEFHLEPHQDEDAGKVFWLWIPKTPTLRLGVGEKAIDINFGCDVDRQSGTYSYAICLNKKKN